MNGRNSRAQKGETMTDELTMTEEQEEWVPPEPEGYTIARKAGPELKAQMDLASWHLRKASEIQAVAEAQLAPFDDEISRLEAEIGRLQGEQQRIQEAAERRMGWHEEQVIRWYLDANLREVTGKAALDLPYGVVKSRQTRGKTEINSDLVMRLYREQPEAYRDLIAESVSVSAVRKRFRLLEDGSVEDTQDGEILAEAVIRQVEPPRIDVTVELTGKPQEDTDAA